MKKPSLLKRLIYGGIGAIEFTREGIHDTRKKIRESLDDFVERGERLNEHEDSVVGALLAALRLKKKVPSSEEIDLLIPGYDDMTVTEILDHLKPLTTRQLEIVRDYEYHNFNRIRIVRQIDKELDEVRIIRDYDELPVGEVVEKLEELDDRKLTLLREYEKKHRNRVTVIRAIDRQKAQKTKKAA
jgi:hypothetical protein